jgi:kynurenine formamidase
MCTELAPPRPGTDAVTTPAGSPLTRRAALLGTAGLATASTAFLGASPASAHDRATRGRRHGTADLSYALGENTPAFTPGEEAIRKPATTIEADGYYMQRWDIFEHIGTHVDAPAHFNANGRYVTELRPDELTPVAVVVDIARKAAADPDAVVTVADLRDHERRHGRIPDRAAVLMYSGWGAKVSDPDAYRGTDAAGVLHFPGFGADATEWLVTRRKVTALGVDTLSIDPGNSATFDAHHILNGAERYGIENLAGLGRIPRRGARITVGVIPFAQGSGGPARVLAGW